MDTKVLLRHHIEPDVVHNGYSILILLELNLSGHLNVDLARHAQMYECIKRRHKPTCLNIILEVILGLQCNTCSEVYTHSSSK